MNYLEKMPEHILRLDLMSQALPNAVFIYVARDWVQVGLSIHRLCANSTRQARWFGCQAAKWNAIKAYAAQNCSPDNEDYISIKRAMDYRQTID